ncbi:hypothetical protein CKO25_15060 [Thiocapsa imhoffii]|uniref:Fibronectin type-III domain-containing protein n=1 Tax=Thiocapsa imhoffii TaxID=382777 RepID=A0A9X0WJN0_9GAMM|nr:hypothetical protein [Thiocapsa imhoffii]MBK1645944.1 hypothetical protein [Thiocapsa imhoffii]
MLAAALVPMTDLFAGTRVCGVDWEWIVPQPQGNRLKSVTHGRGVFVAVGAYGTILTSLDGIQWTLAVSGTRRDLNQVIWTGSQFVVVGRQGAILTSPDGQSWTERLSSVQGDLQSVAWNGERFVATGGLGKFYHEGEPNQYETLIVTSEDGRHWTLQPNDNSVLLMDVIWGHGLWIAVGQAARNQFSPAPRSSFFVSQDGLTWSEVASFGAALKRLAWNGERYLAVGWGPDDPAARTDSSVTLTSADGVHWSVASRSPGIFLDLHWTGDLFVVTGRDGLVATSSNGQAWIEQQTGVTESLDGLAWNQERFVAVGGAGMLLTSQNLTNWVEQSTRNALNFGQIIWDGDQFVAIAGRDILTSRDGVAWAVRHTRTGADRLRTLVWGGGQYLALTGTGILLSVDGITWTFYPGASPLDPLQVIWTGQRFLAINTEGVFASVDGLTWSHLYSSTGSGILHSIAARGSAIVVLERDDEFYENWRIFSPDGNSWTKQSTPHVLNHVISGGDGFVIVGRQGVIMTSPNGVDWRTRASGTTESIEQLIWNGSQYLALAQTLEFQFDSLGINPQVGTMSVLTSADAIDWSRHPLMPTNASGPLAWGADQFLLPRFAGVLRSPCDARIMPPIVETGGKRAIGRESVTLEGSVDEQASNAWVSFEYGPTEVLGEKISAWPRVVEPGTGRKLFTATLTGLNCGTSYHYRATATNGAGTRFGQIRQLMTADCSGLGQPMLNAAVLPYARAVAVGTPATAFGTLINAGDAVAERCAIRLPTSIPALFDFQTADATNHLVGSPNEPVTIPPGGIQSFVFGVTPLVPMMSVEIPLRFDCDNAEGAPSHPGLNTFILSAAQTAPPDLLAIAATPTQDGVIRLPNPLGQAAFAAAAINIGSGGKVLISADDGDQRLPVDLQVCETTATGQWLSCGKTLSRRVAANRTVFYTVVIGGRGEAVAFDPAVNRVFLRFEADGILVGATSVAVTVPEG